MALRTGPDGVQSVWATVDDSFQSAPNEQPVILLDKDEIEKLAALRYALRQFSRKTEIEARRAGLTPQQYLLLLAIKGFPGRDTATITELAERLQIRHNAVIGLVNRAEERGLVGREQSAPGEDRRIVRVRVLPNGDAALQRLASALRDERKRVAAAAAALDQARDDR
jgi:DNA-binding MarR family transcriptional regulator